MILNILIIALLGVAFIIFLNLEHHGRKLKWIALIIIGVLLYFSIANIFTSEDVDLSSPKGIINAVYVYVGWIGETSAKLWDIGKDTTVAVGNAIKLNQSKS